jgi:hypothetical protein
MQRKSRALIKYGVKQLEVTALIEQISGMESDDDILKEFALN